MRAVHFCVGQSRAGCQDAITYHFISCIYFTCWIFELPDIKYIFACFIDQSARLMRDKIM